MLLTSLLILGAGAYAVNKLLIKMGEKQGGDGIPRIGPFDARPLLAMGGIFAGLIGSLFNPLLGAVALAAGVGATYPLLVEQWKNRQIADSTAPGTSGMPSAYDG